MLILHRSLPLSILLLVVAAGTVSAQAQDQTALKPLVDPSVLARADGRERKDSVSGTVEAYLPVLYPSSHAANLLQLKNGDVLCVWFAGTWEGDSNVGIVISRLPKGASRWTATKLIDRHEGESYQNPFLFEAPDGPSISSTPHRGPTLVRPTPTFSTPPPATTESPGPRPVLLFDKPGSFTRHPLLVLAGGTWMFPLPMSRVWALARALRLTTPRRCCPGQRRALVGVPHPRQSRAKSNLPLQALAPDRLVAFFRSRASDFIYLSQSSDGCQWSKPVRTELPNNNASVQVFRLQDGHLVMAFDNSAIDRSGPKPTGGLRKPLSLALVGGRGPILEVRSRS